MASLSKTKLCRDSKKSLSSSDDPEESGSNLNTVGPFLSFPPFFFSLGKSFAIGLSSEDDDPVGTLKIFILWANGFGLEREMNGWETKSLDF